jgi:hypothetical protein
VVGQQFGLLDDQLAMPLELHLLLLRSVCARWSEPKTAV